MTKITTRSSNVNLEVALLCFSLDMMLLDVCSVSPSNKRQNCLRLKHRRSQVTKNTVIFRTEFLLRNVTLHYSLMQAPPIYHISYPFKFLQKPVIHKLCLLWLNSTP